MISTEARVGRIDADDLLTVRQAADLLGIHPNTVRDWGRKGRLAEIRVGPRHDRRYRRRDVLALAQNTATSGAEQIVPVAAKPRTKARRSSAGSSSVGVGVNAIYDSLNGLRNMYRAMDQVSSISRSIAQSFQGIETASLLAQSFDTSHLHISETVAKILEPTRMASLMPTANDLMLGSANDDLLTSLGDGVFGRILAEQRQFSRQMAQAVQWTPPTLSGQFTEALLPARRAIDTIAEIAGTAGAASLTVEQAHLTVSAYQTFSMGLFGAAYESARPDTADYLSFAKFRAAGSILDSSMGAIKGLGRLGLPSAGDLGLTLPRPTIYRRFEAEVDERRDEFAQLHSDEIDAELEQTLALQISRTATRISEARRACNQHVQQLGEEPIFKPTSASEYISCMLPQWVVADEEQFRQFIDWMFRYVYESSGELKRIKDRVGIPPVTMTIKFLRHFYFHDLEHGEAREIERKHKRVGEEFNRLVGVAIVKTPAQWQRAQLTILREVETLLQDLNNHLRHG